MLIYRICRAEFASDLRASGVAGRWNQRGQRVLYGSATRSLAALELLANRSGRNLLGFFRIMVLEVDGSIAAQDTSVRMVHTTDLPSDWCLLSGYNRLQNLGAEWYQRAESLVMCVPSVLIHKEYNYLINTQHPDFGERVRLVDVENLEWDSRFFL